MNHPRLKGLRIANPKMFLLLDKSYIGGGGYHLRSPDDRPETPQKAVPTPTQKAATAPTHEGDTPLDRRVTVHCGHEEEIPDHVTQNANGFRAYRAWAKANLDCLQCYWSKMASEARPQPEELALPNLRGTDRQVNWAIDIRRKCIVEFRGIRGSIGPLPPRIEKRLEKRLAVAEAGWWINSRGLSLDAFVAVPLPRHVKSPEVA